MSEITEFKSLIDHEGRIITWSPKRALQLVALDYLASKFQTGKMYTLSEVDDLLNQWHAFGDPALLRRELTEIGHITAIKDGTEYWPTPRTRQW